jgi:cell division protein FtsW
LGFIGIQPGEFIKYTIALVAIPFFEEFDKSTTKQIINRAFVILLPLVLLVMQPDFGTFSISFLVLVFVGFYSSFNRKYFYLSSAVGVVCAGITLISQPYRVARLLTFLDPWKNPQGSGFQIIQSYMGFANGALFGKGLGNSHEKLFYLPEAHNDFIFSVIGEELGFIGVFFLVCLYAVLIYQGFRIGLEIEKKWYRLLVLTVTFTIGLQATLNMGVVLGLLPTKGLNLPFISYGGSSLLSNLFALGILFSAVTSWIKSQNDLESMEQKVHSQFQSFT